MWAHVINPCIDDKSILWLHIKELMMLKSIILRYKGVTPLTTLKRILLVKGGSFHINTSHCTGIFDIGRYSIVFLGYTKRRTSKL